MLPPEFVRKLSFRLRSNFLPCLFPFSKVLHFLHNGSQDHSPTLYLEHESLKFITTIREKNRNIHITCTSSFYLYNWVVLWIPCCRTGEFIIFSIYSTRAETRPSCAASTASDPESEDYSCLTPQFWWHSSAKMDVSLWNMHNYNNNNNNNNNNNKYIYIKKMYRCTTKMCPT